MKLQDPSFVSQSFFNFGDKPIDLSQFKLDDVVQKMAPAGHTLNIKNWLPYAADAYQISADIKDYLIVPIPAFVSDLPNTNGEAATLRELMVFNPETGLMAYETFKRMPTFADHDNRDITKAKGVIFDAYIKKINGFGGGRYYKSVQLLGFDRTKDPMLCRQIETKVRNTYSVGYYYKAYKCSICGKVVSKNVSPCEHTKLGIRTYPLPDGRLVYRQNLGIKGFENSSVESPAYAIAVGPVVFDHTNAQMV